MVTESYQFTTKFPNVLKLKILHQKPNEGYALFALFVFLGALGLVAQRPGVITLCRPMKAPAGAADSPEDSARARGRVGWREQLAEDYERNTRCPAMQPRYTVMLSEAGAQKQMARMGGELSANTNWVYQHQLVRKGLGFGLSNMKDLAKLAALFGDKPSHEKISTRIGSPYCH